MEESAPEVAETVVAPTGSAQEADDDDDDDFGPMPVSVEEQGIANKKRRGISLSFPHFLPLALLTLLRRSSTATREALPRPSPFR